MITGVEVTRDPSVARVYYYVIGDGAEEVGAAFERASGFPDHGSGRRFDASDTGAAFHFDESIDHGRRVEGILAQLEILPERQQEEELGSEEE